jgi:SAM-dependent methyltransferase
MTQTGTVLVSEAGDVTDLAVDRWRDRADAVELSLLATVPNPVLDVGCGPGRIATALAAAGRIALGVDTSPWAVDEAIRRRAPVLRRSVFDPLPGEGRWATVLLLDGNVGIGGDPGALLARCAELVRPGGHVIVELEPPGVATRAVNARLHSPAGYGPWFPWAHVGIDAFPDLATSAGLHAAGGAVGGGRWFGRAVRL